VRKREERKIYPEHLAHAVLHAAPQTSAGRAPPVRRKTRAA
jgi:hypothetical protein